MSGSYPQFVPKVEDERENEFALTAHQLDGALDPAVPVRALIAKRPRPAFINRPYLIWRDNPEIARIINDRLSRNAAN